MVDEGEIIVGITARSILELLGIIWNYFLNSFKICIKFHWNSWNYCGIPGIPLGLLHDEKFQLFPPRWSRSGLEPGTSVSKNIFGKRNVTVCDETSKIENRKK